MLRSCRTKGRYTSYSVSPFPLFCFYYSTVFSTVNSLSLIHIFYEVKYGLSNLVAAAEERGAQIALFGHTHQAMTEYRGGLYLMNPGSLSGPSGTYGIIDLTPAGIVTNILHL